MEMGLGFCSGIWPALALLPGCAKGRRGGVTRHCIPLSGSRWVSAWLFNTWLRLPAVGKAQRADRRDHNRGAGTET